MDQIVKDLALKYISAGDVEKAKELLRIHQKDIDHERLEVLIEGLISDLVKILQENDGAISPLPSEKSLEDLNTVILRKNLRLKEVDGQLRGAIEADFQYENKSYVPSESQLDKINKMVMEKQSEDSVIIAALQAADCEVDRGFEKFTNNAIDTFVKMYPDKPVLLDHNWSAEAIVGKVYDASNQNGKLVLEAYFPKNEKNKATVENVINGTYCKLSVGFSAAPEDMTCSACGNSMFDVACKHQPGDILPTDGSRVTLVYKDIKDVFEVSIVAVPMNADCHIRDTTSKSLNSATSLVTKDFANFTDGEITNLEKEHDPKKPYGDVEYADPGYKEDGIHRYPISTEEHIRAAWNYINQERNHEGYTAEQVEHIKNRIISAWKEKIDPEGPPGASEKSLKDTINDDKDTIRNSSPMEKNQTDVETTPANQEALLDTLEAITTTKEAGVDDTVGPSIHDKLDAHCKMIGKLMNDHNETKGMVNEMLGHVKSIHEKCDGLSGLIKSLPATSLENLEKKSEELEKVLAEVKKTLELNLHVSTEGVKRLLTEPSRNEETAVEKKKLWFKDFFGNDADDLGGQQ